MTTPALRQEGLKAIIFDLDGTLYQDERLGNAVNLAACRYIASLKGVTVEEADAMLMAKRCSVNEGCGTLSSAVMALGGTLKELHERMSLDVRPEGVLKVDQRVIELLERLGERFELHLYTNNNNELSARIMAEIGVSGMFRRIFTIQDSWRPKPDMTVLAGILEAIGRKPAETLFVGDRYEVDLALPASLGCQIFEARTVEELLGLEQLLQNM